MYYVLLLELSVMIIIKIEIFVLIADVVGIHSEKYPLP